MNNFDVLVVDSGVGGLSVAEEISTTQGLHSICYFADFAEFPYGSKSEEWLVARLHLVLEQLVDLVHPKVIVVACNTASTTVLPSLRESISIPIVGVVPAIKPAAEQTKNKIIGLLATPGTVVRPYTQALIDQFASHCRVIKVGSRSLVEAAEQKLRGVHLPPQIFKDSCRDFFAEDGTPIPDTIVLGCTHFPHLKEELSNFVSQQILWIDSGKAIATRVASLLGESAKEVHRERLFLASGLLDKKLKPYLMGTGFTIREISITD